MTQFISAKKCATCYMQTIIQFNELQRTCHSHQKKIPGDTEFSFLWNESDPVLLIQCATRYARQRTETQNAKHWRNGFSNFSQNVLTSEQLGLAIIFVSLHFDLLDKTAVKSSYGHRLHSESSALEVQNSFLEFVQKIIH